MSVDGVPGDLQNFRIRPNDTKRKAKMLVTTIDWIQWNTNSTLHSAFFKALKDSTSMPTPSMTPWKKTQQICWNDLSAFANAHHLVSWSDVTRGRPSASNDFATI